MTNEKVYQMLFTKVYPLLINKVEKKGRTQAEADELICWLTGYSQQELEAILKTETTYGDFFRNAPHMNEDRKLITGKICGISVESIEEPLMQDIRYLDKIIDELAKGKAMEKIMRKPKCCAGTDR